MKKIALIGVPLLLGTLFSTAQTKALQTVKISTPTAQCEPCKLKIEEYLKRLDGVSYVNVAVKKKETTVKFLSDRTNLETVKAFIANAGFQADEIAANPESYKLLPKCCKRLEDGGGIK